MGILIDSSLIIEAERSEQEPSDVLARILKSRGNVNAVLSVITVAELAHGIERANSEQRRRNRERFLAAVILEIPIQPITVAVSSRAGRINGQLQAVGLQVPLADLLIGATALELGYALVTHNIRHFKMIPNLSVMQL